MWGNKGENVTSCQACLKNWDNTHHHFAQFAVKPKIKIYTINELQIFYI